MEKLNLYASQRGSASEQSFAVDLLVAIFGVAKKHGVTAKQTKKMLKEIRKKLDAFVVVSTDQLMYNEGDRHTVVQAQKCFKVIYKAKIMMSVVLLQNRQCHI